MGEDLEVILRRLPKLSPTELDKVGLRINFLRGSTTTKKSTSEYDWLLEGLIVELRRRGLWAGRTVPKKLITEKYTEKAAEVRTYLLKGLNRSKLSAVEYLSLGVLAGFVLAEYLNKAKASVSVKILLLNIDKVPLALEEAFPGYWAAKLLAFCLPTKKSATNG